MVGALALAVAVRPAPAAVNTCDVRGQARQSARVSSTLACAAQNNSSMGVKTGQMLVQRQQRLIYKNWLPRQCCRTPLIVGARGKEFQVLTGRHRHAGQSQCSGTRLSTDSATHIIQTTPAPRQCQPTLFRGQIRPQLTPQPSPQPAAAPCKHQPARRGPLWRPLGACRRQHWRTAA